jgi:hypothetical protein
LLEQAFSKLLAERCWRCTRLVFERGAHNASAVGSRNCSGDGESSS